MYFIKYYGYCDVNRNYSVYTKKENRDQIIVSVTFYERWHEIFNLGFGALRLYSDQI